MKRVLFYTTLLFAVLLCRTPTAEALTYGVTYYRQHLDQSGTGSPGDPLRLFINEVDGILAGGGGVASLVFTPGTVPTSTEGSVYYDSAGNNLKLYNGSAWVDIDVAGASSLGTAYGVGSAITVDTSAITLTTTEAADNVALAIVHAETGNFSAMTIASAAAYPSLAFTSTGTGTDVTGTSATWNVTKAGVATFTGIDVGATDIVLENDEIINNVDDDVIEFDGTEDFEIDLSGTNIIKFTSDSSAITLEFDTLDRLTGIEDITFDAEAGNITLTADAGAEDLTISQAGAVDASLILTSAGTGTDALSLITTAADISLVSADNITRTAADNITDVTTDGGYTLTIGGATNGDYAMTAADEASMISVGAFTIQNTEAASNITVNSVLGSIYIEAEEDAADAILITADGGTSSTLTLFNDTGTAADSIEFLTDVGGITGTASAGAIVFTATGGTAGDMTLSAGDILTLTSVDTKIFDGAAAETWIIEGTANDHEASIVFTDPTADVVYTFPVAAASTLSVMTSTLATNAPDIANSVTGGTSTLIFEGSAVDAHEHTVTATNPTADIVWTLPDAGAQTVSFMSSTLATNMPEVVNSVTGGTNQLIFEGTANAFETILTAADATADATLTLPDDSGNLAYVADGGKTTKDATNAAIPLTDAVVEGTSGAASAWSLADGKPGQILTVVIVTDGGEATITPTTSTGWATAILTDDMDTITLMFADAVSGWIVLGTAGDGTNLVALTQ